MGAVKNWLMEMEDYIYMCLSSTSTVEKAKAMFLKQYPTQGSLFDRYAGNNDHDFFRPKGIDTP